MCVNVWYIMFRYEIFILLFLYLYTYFILHVSILSSFFTTYVRHNLNTCVIHVYDQFRKRITKALSEINREHFILIKLRPILQSVVIISTTKPTRDFRKKRNDLPCILSLLFHLSLNLFLHNRWSQEKYKNTEKHEVVRIISCFTDAIQ